MARGKTGTQHPKPISIKKSNQGKLRSSTKTKKGQKIPIAKLQSLKKNGTPLQKKRANFALNARKWNSKGSKKS
jgi:hypothetical protein